jgi:hypothetical protein
VKKDYLYNISTIIATVSNTWINAWVDMYAEGVRNAAMVTEYWLDSFYKMGFGKKVINRKTV